MTDSRPVRARKEVGAPLKRLLKFRQEIMVKKKKKREIMVAWTKVVSVRW